MQELKQQPTLKDLQKYVLDMEKERSFSKDVAVNLLMLGEEVGELFKAIRKHGNLNKIDSNSKFGSVDEELADILIFICAIANRFEIDLEKAFRDKEEINNKRVWK